jgi:dTDP-4-dehydrorhamnose 3,5-epimerase-like enzyme
MKTIRKLDIENNMWNDDRGWGLNLLTALERKARPIGDLHVVSLKPGKIRGNHYHEKSTEWILFLGGKAKLIWREVGKKSINSVMISGLTPTLYEVPPNIEHAILNEDQQDIYLMSINDLESRGTVKSTKLFPSILK